MKGLTISLLLILPHSAAICQPTEFAPVGAKWYYGFQWNGMDFDPMFYTIESLKDTIVFGKNCRHLESSVIYEFSSEKQEDIFVYQSVDTVYYAIPKLSGEELDTSFHILYCFNSDVGDSWDINYGDYLGFEDSPCPGGPDDYIQVDSIGTENIAGLNLKRISYHTEGDVGWGFQGDAYELLGNATYMFPIHFGCLVESPYPGYLNCYEDPNVGNIVFNPYGCIYFSEVSDARPDITIFPNPANDFVAITSSIVIEKVIIYNMEGRQLYTSTISGATIEVETVNFEPGLYIIEMSSGDHQTFYHQFMKTSF